MAFAFKKLVEAIRAGNSTPSVPSFYFNFSNPQNVTLGAAQARGNITSTQNAVIAASVSPSRTTGVAPLYVNFDATGTTSTLSTNPSHELFFAHDFGDTGAGTWANGVQSSGLTSKNAGYGPVTGHVYETPGTFPYTLVITDGVNTVIKTGTVVVLDPNTVYAGTNTICISHSGNFTGAPSGAMQINTAGNTDMFAAWNTYKASNKRILFCKANNWTSSATVSFYGLTGTMLNGYGTGVAHSFASGTMVSLAPDTSPSNGAVFQVGGSSNCHVGNIKIAANATHTGVVGSAFDGNIVTVYKVEVRGAYSAFSTSSYASQYDLFKYDQFCMYECVHDDAYGYAAQNTPRVTGALGAVGTPGVFTSVGHPFKRFNRIRLVGTAPSGLNTGTDYYISAHNLTANTFSLSAAVNIDTPLAISVASTCDVTAQGLGGGQGVFIAMTRGGIMGCYFDNCNNGEQTVRISYIDRCHITNNYIARPNQTKNVFKIHCRSYTDILALSSGYSEKFVVSANVMDLRGGYSYNGTSVTHVGTPTIIIGNGGGAGDQRVRNCIVENNFTYGCLGNPKDYAGAFEAYCPNMTIRNNIADMSCGDRAAPYSGPYRYTNLCLAYVASLTADRTTGVRIYNNTLYSNLASANHAYFVIINSDPEFPDVDDITIKNNIWYAPHYSGPDKSAWFDGKGTATRITASNNTDSVIGGGATNSPNFAVQPPRDGHLEDWRPNTGSYAIGSGTVVPVLKDFNMATRMGAYDMGAVLP